MDHSEKGNRGYDTRPVKYARGFSLDRRNKFEFLCIRKFEMELKIQSLSKRRDLLFNE